MLALYNDLNVAKLYLSVVVPAYNEEYRVRYCAGELARYFRKRRRPFEIIFADDGSRDRTTEEAERVARRIREVRVISYPINRGKGCAVRKGVLAARGSRVLFLDADLSTRPEEWPKLERLLDRGVAVAIGSRKMAGAKLVKRQPWWRERLGKVFTWIVRSLLVRVSDVTCGFKALERGAARRLFSRQVLDDWSFDAEVLFLADRWGMRIEESPVVWKDTPNTTKVRVIRDALGSLAGIARIRWNHLVGRYGSR